MSAYPYYSFSFETHQEVEAHAWRVLEAVAADTPPSASDLALLHPVPRYYLADWRRLLTDATEPHIGPPVRISGTRSVDSQERILSIEFSQHDDEKANGGFLFWLWVLRLVNRPTATFAPQPNAVIGLHGLYRNDYDSKLIRTTSDGFDFGSTSASFAEIDEYWDTYSAEFNSFPQAH